MLFDLHNGVVDAWVSDLADELWHDAREKQQAVRRVVDDAVAVAVRAEVRRLAAAEGVHIRTARMDDLVAVVRRDADIWTDDQATMRRKLSLPTVGLETD